MCLWGYVVANVVHCGAEWAKLMVSSGQRQASSVLTGTMYCSSACPSSTRFTVCDIHDFVPTAVVVSLFLTKVWNLLDFGMRQDGEANHHIYKRRI